MQARRLLHELTTGARRAVFNQRRLRGGFAARQH
jgi:hypothetical protein